MTGEARTDGRTTDTRARIEATALDLFTSKGFAATSLRDIADALGITKAALYYHFPAKADIAAALVQPFIHDIDAFMTQTGNESRPPRRILEAYLDTLIGHVDVLVAIMRDSTLLAHIDLESAAVRWIEHLPELLVGADPSPAERLGATIAVAGLSRAAMLPSISREDLRTAGVDAALRALGPGPADAVESTG